MRPGWIALFVAASTAACVQMLGGDQEPSFRAASEADDGGPATSTDARSDGRSDAIAPITNDGPWCKQNHPDGPTSRCVDFDGTTAGTWDLRDRGIGSVTSPGNASPQSFLSKLDATHFTSNVSTTFAGMDAARSVALEFDFQLRRCDTAGRTVLASIYLPPSGRSLALLVGDGRKLSARQCPGSSSNCVHDLDSLGSAPTEGWLHAQLRLVLSPQPMQTVSIASLIGTPYVAWTESGATSYPEVAAYVGFAEPTTRPSTLDCEALFDNVWFETR